MMPRLSVQDRNRLLGQYQAGVSPTKISKIFKVSRVTIYKIIKKSQTEKSLKDRHRTGRPRLTIAKTDTNLVEILELVPLKP